MRRTKRHTKRRGVERAESGLTVTQDARLQAMAIRKGWIDARFPTQATEQELKEQVKETGGTLIEKATLAAHQLMKGNTRSKGIAIKTVVAMESQNMADEHKQKPDLHLHSHQVDHSLIIVEKIVDGSTYEGNQAASGASGISQQ